MNHQPERGGNVPERSENKNAPGQLPRFLQKLDSLKKPFAMIGAIVANLRNEATAEHKERENRLHLNQSAPKEIIDLLTLPINKVYILGRSRTSDIILRDSTDTVSRQHARIQKTESGNYQVKDGVKDHIKSFNGTSYQDYRGNWVAVPNEGVELQPGDKVKFGDLEIRLPGERPGIRHDLTVMHQKQVVKNPDFKRHEDQIFYKGRELYHGRGMIDGKIHACIYPNGKERLIVFDMAKDHRLKDNYQLLKERVSKLNPDSKNHEKDILEMVHEHVKESLRFTDSVDDIIQRRLQIPKGTKIRIGVFLEAGMGVCSHQALLVVSHLQQLQKEGILDGESFRHRCRTTRGAHAWARFESKDGTVYIIDPAQDVCAKLKDIKKYHWPYFKQDDIQ